MHPWMPWDHSPRPVARPTLAPNQSLPEPGTAVRSDNLSTAQMKLIGQIVADNTTVVNADYLAKRIIEHGHTTAQPDPNKTIWSNDVSGLIIGYVQSTLEAPDEVYAKGDTRVLYIKDVGEWVGYEQATAHTDNPEWRRKVGVVIDLQNLPDDTPINDDLATIVEKIALIVAYPTK